MQQGGPSATNSENVGEDVGEVWRGARFEQSRKYPNQNK